MKTNLSITFFAVIMLSLLGLFAIGCEPYQAITFENKTTVPVKVIEYRVPQEYTGNPTGTWNDPGAGDIIAAGESKKFVTNVPNTRVTREKFVVIAVSEMNGMLFSKIFTWDELHEANWRVVIQ